MLSNGVMGFRPIIFLRSIQYPASHILSDDTNQDLVNLAMEDSAPVHRANAHGTLEEISFPRVAVNRVTKDQGKLGVGRTS